MNSIGRLKLESKILIASHKSISSITNSVFNPPIYRQKNELGSQCFNPFTFFQNFNKCRMLYKLKDAKLVHAHLLVSDALSTGPYISNSLLAWYSGCGGIGYALKLFDGMRERNVISWNTLISGCNNGLLYDEPWRIFVRMRKYGFAADQFTYGSVLSACTALRDVVYGKQIYSVVMKDGFFSDGYVRTGLVDLFSKSGCFADALRVFYDLLCENVVCWNAVISGAVWNGENRVALKVFSQMVWNNLVPNGVTCSCVLAACAALEELHIGRVVQGWVIKLGVRDTIVGTAVVDLYAKGGEMDKAVKAFLCLPSRNVVTWTAIISGFSRLDDSISALRFFNEMRKVEAINKYTLTSIISTCAKPMLFEVAVQIHSLIVKNGFYLDSAVSTALMNMYSKLRDHESTDKVFHEMGDIVDSGSWASVMSAFSHSKNPQRAIALLQNMFCEGMRPDEFCLSCVLIIVEDVDLGRQLHCYTLKTGLSSDIAVGSSLLTMYSKCGSFEDSVRVFRTMVFRDGVALASMISGYVDHGCPDEAFELFRAISSKDIKVDEVLLSSILTACSALQLMQKGKEVHGCAIRSGFGFGTHIGGALVTLYSKCGSLRLAKKVFDILPQKDSLAWSSVISGYAHSLFVDEALLLFHEMRVWNVEVDPFIISSLLGAAALSDGQSIGFQLHSLVKKVGLDSHAQVGSSLLSLYSKCGTAETCRQVFDQIEKPDLIAWTSMIQSYAQNGNGAEALKFFNVMKESGIKPDAVTFVSVLSACSHHGLVEEGYHHLNSMNNDCRIEPGYRHYACMVDMLGRAGRLEEAKKFIENLPIKPDTLLWSTLLAACKVHGDTELGKQVAKQVLDLQPSNCGVHVSLSNIYALDGKWDQVEELRGQLRQSGVRKEAAYSSM